MFLEQNASATHGQTWFANKFHTNVLCIQKYLTYVFFQFTEKIMLFNILNDMSTSPPLVHIVSVEKAFVCQIPFTVLYLKCCTALLIN